MANYRAIAAVSEAVISSLADRYDSALFGSELDFKVYTAQDFAAPMNAGVSLCLYRISPNPNHSTGAMRRPGQHPRLPLDLHFLLTAWGKDASLRHAVIGWAMRVLEDTPTLSVTQLNAVWSDVFRRDEAIEIVIDKQVGLEQLAQIWDSFIRQGYQLSVPYTARVVEIESLREQDSGAGVRVAESRYRQLEVEDDS